MKQLFRFWNRLWFLNFLHLTRKKKKRKKSLAEILYPQFKALTSMKHFLWIWQFFFVIFFFHSKQQQKLCIYIFIYFSRKCQWSHNQFFMMWSSRHKPSLHPCWVRLCSLTIQTYRLKKHLNVNAKEAPLSPFRCLQTVFIVSGN